MNFATSADGLSKQSEKKIDKVNSKNRDYSPSCIVAASVETNPSLCSKTFQEDMTKAKCTVIP